MLRIGRFGPSRQSLGARPPTRLLTSSPLCLTSPRSSPPLYRAPIVRKRASAHGNASKSQSKSSWGWGRSAPPAGPGALTARAVKASVLEHLRTAWLKKSAQVGELAQDLGLDRSELGELTYEFTRHAIRDVEAGRGWDLAALKDALAKGGPDTLRQQTLAAFVRWAATQPLDGQGATLATLAKLHHLARLTDLRFPGEAYPAARQHRRKLILHVGPTNSGKTHSALVALARARTGVYAGPLRLLAHEVFSRFNEGKIGDEGKRVCNLVTGEEQKILAPFAGLSSCTVEMFPLSQRLDVGVVDEIQMIGDSQRGSAWTNAVVGSQCDVLHLCGEESVVELVQSIAADLGDECVVKRYERLSPLSIAPESLQSDLSKIQRGDCLVTFSRNNIFAFKRLVEEKTGLRVAVAYGGLPPEVREEQARAFNEGNYDVLVASDAVGMGLNLKIKRIVFETLNKWDGKAEVNLSMPQIKQIAGRAGRFGVHTSPTAPDDAEATATTTLGVVTTLDESDMDLLREAIKAPVVQVTKAVLQPSRDAFRGVYQLLPPTTPLSKVNEIVLALAHTSLHYSTAPSVSPANIADALQHVEPLSFAERAILTIAPVNERDPKAVEALVSFAKQFAAGELILIDAWATESGLASALRRVEEARAGTVPAAGLSSKSIYSPAVLMNLESFHRCLTLYLWLSYRLPVGFVDFDNARLKRKEVERAIDFTLAGLRFERKTRASKDNPIKELWTPSSLESQEVRKRVPKRLAKQTDWSLRE